jgi:hypothetical protein
MSNEYFPTQPDLAPGVLARSSDINNRTKAAETAFEKLPRPASGKKGFGEPVTMSDPIDDDHGVTKGWLNREMASPINVARGARDEALSSAQASTESKSQSAEFANQASQSASSSAGILENINNLLQLEKGDKGDVGEKGDKGEQGAVGAVFSVSGSVLTITT